MKAFVIDRLQLALHLKFLMVILLQSFCIFFFPKVRTFVHILDKGNQDWFAVLSILEDLVQQLKRLSPLLKELFLRSDNAGCYHNAALLISAPTITRTGGLALKNYSFSEANSGKDVCDRKIAPLKAHIGRYLNEGDK